MGITISDIIKAQNFLRPFGIKAPLRFCSTLSQEFNAEIYVKHENLNLSGAFKIRGGLYFIGTLSPSEREKGVIAATRGNHGIGLAIAGKMFQTRVTIVVPEKNSNSKNRLITSYGAELIEHGRDYNEAKDYCEELARQTGKVYAHTANEPRLLCAAGTCALEIFEDLPDVDIIITPIGGGSLISGSIIVRNAVNPETKIIGVQPEKANAYYLSWKKGHLVPIDSADTLADGLATRTAFELPFFYIKNNVHEILTVSEEEIMEAIQDGIEHTHSLIEGAAATTLAALRKLGASVVRGKKVVLILTGSNIDRELLFHTLSNHKEATLQQ